MDWGKSEKAAEWKHRLSDARCNLRFDTIPILGGRMTFWESCCVPGRAGRCPDRVHQVSASDADSADLCVNQYTSRFLRYPPWSVRKRSVHGDVGLTWLKGQTEASWQISRKYFAFKRP